MIEGVVRRREALVRLAVRGVGGLQQEIEAVVDSGHTGWLTLPPALIAALGLRWETISGGILADGSFGPFAIYRATIEWDRRLRRIFVAELDSTPLIGMSLLRGYEYKMQVRAQGRVTIRRLNSRW
jgi:clan AA aspartic protease